MLGGVEVLLSPEEWVWPGSAARMLVSPKSIWKVRPRAAPGFRRTWGGSGGERLAGWKDVQRGDVSTPRGA